jgi:hypothetical protein
VTPLILPAGITCACERNQWERRPGDGGVIICCGACGTIAAIVSNGGAPCSPPGPIWWSACTEAEAEERDLPEGEYIKCQMATAREESR